MKKLIPIFLLSMAFLVTCKKPTNIESGFAEVNGTQLYFEVAGSGDPIVLIHGNYGDSRHWDDQFEVFAKEYKVIRYDVRGYGKSSVPVEGGAYSHPDDLKALLEYLGISKAHITGFSMGCVIAVDFVLTYPDMSNSLIAVGPWVSGFRSPLAQEVYDDFREVSSILKESGIEPARDFLVDLHYLRPSKPIPDVNKRMEEIIHDFSFWTFTHKDLQRRLSPPAIQQLDKLNLPTLILTSDHDIEACKEVADLLERTIPNSRKTVIADASHISMLEKPVEFNKAILDFLDFVRNGQ
ncbi:MAG: alpha/beta fold hydrolase [Candidatus Heimdallarchaeota archaeon]